MCQLELGNNFTERITKTEGNLIILYYLIQLAQKIRTTRELSIS